MIAFATLLLGLISGVYPIEVRVSGPVATVVLELDGVAVGTIDGAPWLAEIDLGASLRPHELAARALDADGKEIARTSQSLNLPRPPAEVEIVLEKGPDGVPTAALLVWQSVSGVAPSAITLTMDGQRLPVDHSGRAPLPRRELDSVHVVTAELRFPPDQLARVDVAFGGAHGGEVSSELTAVAVRFAGEAAPAPEALAGWFAVDGCVVPVAAVDAGPAEVILVRAPPGPEVVARLVPASRKATLVPAFRQQMLLAADDRVRFLSVASGATGTSRVPAELFELSPELRSSDGGFFWYLTSIHLRHESAKRQAEPRITDAVAVAGLQAAAAKGRRAVVLVLDNEVRDASRYSPAVVREYLQSLRVPLVVWSLYGPGAPAAEPWGAVDDISSIAKLDQAVARLRAELAPQRIVWIAGRHLPQTVSLTPAARGVELATTP